MSPDDSSANIETGVESVGDAIVAAMAAGGIDHLFFTSGSEIGFYQEAVAKATARGHNNPMRLVTVPLEHVSLNAALGYSAVSGKPVATAAHVDCGTQHYGGAIHTAWRTGLPIVITAGFPPTAATGSMPGARDDGGHLWVQEGLDQNGIMRNYTKWDHCIAWQDNPGLITSRAIQIARSEPTGPVYISVPKEISLLDARDRDFPTADQLGISKSPAPHPAAFEDLAKRLVKAKHPVAIVSGSGRDLESVPALVTLCEMLGIAVVDSVRRQFLSFPLTHPLFQAQSALKEADVVLVIDAEVPWMPNMNPPPDDAYVAAIAHDPIRLRIPTYEFRADARYTADPRLAIEALTEAARGMVTDADKKRIAARSAKLADAAKARIAAVEEEAKARAGDTPISPLWTSYQIGKLVDDNTVLLDDTLGGPRLREFIPSSRPGSYFCNPGSSGGWSPGAAFGAKLAAPDRDVIAVTGDGFYTFGTPAPAIWAAAHYNAPFLIVVYVNRSFSTGTTAVGRVFGRDGYAAKGGYEGGYFDPPIDYAKEAEAAGGYGETVRDPADLAAALKRGLEQTRKGKPAVIAVWQKRLEGED